ncbi:MAG: hypothetical protein WC503_02405 [Candidatus Shapirobacteria bacterium]
MTRFLNTLQGMVSLVLVVLAGVFGWPIWMAILGIVIPIALSFVIFTSREESPKGRTREGIELVAGIIIGIGGMLFWLFGSEIRPSLSSATPLWLAVSALPSVLFNLGIVFAWICMVLNLLFSYGQELFEFLAGERVGAG